jgi:hypothetical protein
MHTKVKVKYSHAPKSIENEIKNHEATPFQQNLIFTERIYTSGSAFTYTTKLIR